MAKAKADHARQHRLKKLGFTVEMYEARLRDQGDVCGICREARKKNARRFAADHNHRSKRARGILCAPCNLLIGSAGENIQVLEDAIAYLLRWRRLHREAS